MPTSGRSLPAAPAALFAYGTLRFPDVLMALLGRVPEHTPTIAPGRRVARLAPAGALVTGVAMAIAEDIRGAALLAGLALASLLTLAIRRRVATM